MAREKHSMASRWSPAVNALWPRLNRSWASSVFRSRGMVGSGGRKFSGEPTTGGRAAAGPVRVSYRITETRDIPGYVESGRSGDDLRHGLVTWRAGGVSDRRRLLRSLTPPARQDVPGSPGTHFFSAGFASSFFFAGGT